MAEPKTRENDASVDAFIDALDDPRRQADCRALVEMMQAAAGAPPRMWGKSIVGFGHYTYVYASGRSGEWMRIGFSPRKRDLTLYIMPGFEGFEALLAQLGKHKTGKSCLYVKRLEGLNLEVLQQLIDASLAHMAEAYPDGA